MFGTPVRPEAVGTFKEFCLTNRLQNLKNTLLYQPVLYRWDSQRAHFPVTLGDFHTLYLSRRVPFQGLLNISDKVCIVPSFQIIDCFAVHSRRPAPMVGFQISVCQPDIFFRHNDRQEVCKNFSIFAVCIQFVENLLHIVVFTVAEFTAFGCPFACQGQNLPPGAVLFLVILEPMNFVYSSLSFICD